MYSPFVNVRLVEYARYTPRAFKPVYSLHRVLSLSELFKKLLDLGMFLLSYTQ
jgi:hypothetical protein